MPAVQERSAELSINGISKRYGEFLALRDVSFSVRRGEILGLIGPNGSGKTTLFRCIAGLSPATSGSVDRAGVAVPPGRRKHHLFFIPEGAQPWAAQTVAWVLRFVAGLHGATLDRASSIAATLSLDHLLASHLGSLSKGEHRRVMLAVGLLTPHAMLMLDEPFDGLDLRQTRDVMRVIREASAAGRTMFLSIHQLIDAERICDSLVVLSGGRVVGEGTLEELRARAGVTNGGLEEVFLALT
jgi:ABC-type multidrug transport system ATPase subunit